jgi:hypothetical protein
MARVDKRDVSDRVRQSRRAEDAAYSKVGWVGWAQPASGCRSSSTASGQCGRFTRPRRRSLRPLNDARYRGISGSVPPRAGRPGRRERADMAASHIGYRVARSTGDAGLRPNFASSPARTGAKANAVVATGAYPCCSRASCVSCRCAQDRHRTTTRRCTAPHRSAVRTWRKGVLAYAHQAAIARYRQSRIVISALGRTDRTLRKTKREAVPGRRTNNQ